MFRELRLTFVFVIMSYIAWRAPRAGVNLTWIWLGSLPLGFAAGHWISQNPGPRMRYLRLYGAALWCAALVCALVRESYQIPAEQILPALLAAVGTAVKGGQPVATVGNSGGNPESGLYFELRHRGLAFDPRDRSTPMPAVLQYALERHPHARSVFERLSPSRRKEIMRYIGHLKGEVAITRNVARAIAFLEGRERFAGRDKP